MIQTAHSLALALALPCAVAFALPSAAQSEDRAIACATTNIMSERAICAWEDYRRVHVQVIRRINRALLVSDAMDESGKARDALIASHEAWEVYREETCSLETQMFSGDAVSLAYSSCLKRITEARNHDLRVFLQEMN